MLVPWPTATARKAARTSYYQSSDARPGLDAPRFARANSAASYSSRQTTKLVRVRGQRVSTTSRRSISPSSDYKLDRIAIHGGYQKVCCEADGFDFAGPS